MREGQCIRRVPVGEIALAHDRYVGTDRYIVAHSTKLKTVTLLPTGENRAVPSGLKRRFPWL